MMSGTDWSWPYRAHVCSMRVQCAPPARAEPNAFSLPWNLNSSGSTASHSSPQQHMGAETSARPSIFRHLPLLPLRLVRIPAIFLKEHAHHSLMLYRVPMQISDRWNLFSQLGNSLPHKQSLSVPPLLERSDRHRGASSSRSSSFLPFFEEITMDTYGF